MSGSRDIAVEATSFQDRQAYFRRLAGQTWLTIGLVLWPELKRSEDERGAEAEAVLKASCAASRHAKRAGLPWPPASSGRRSGLLE